MDVQRSAYANLQTANSPLVDATTHPSLEAAVTVLGEWLAYLGDPAQIYPGGGHYAAAYSPSRGQPGMSIFYQWWYALKKNLWGGGMSPGEPFVGTVNFSDTSIDGGDYLDETTYNMFLHLLEGLAAGVPQHFTGDYFGGHRDEIIIESLNDAILELSGTAPLPRRGYRLCRGGRHDTLGGACAKESNVVRYGEHTRHQHACRTTFLRQAALWGLDKRDLTHNINFFMNVPLTASGGLTFEDGLSGPGKYVEVRAERELIVLISNCPQLNNPCSGWNPTPIRVLTWAADT